MYYFSTANTSSAFQESIEDIQQMPQFFSDSINWGIDASYQPSAGRQRAEDLYL